MQLLPNWLHGLVPGRYWPSKPRDAYAYTLNVLNLAINGAVGSAVDRPVAFSKKYASLVWGGCALLTDPADTFLIAPVTANPPGVFIRLSNPAADAAYSNVQQLGGQNVPTYLPIQNVLACPGPAVAGAGSPNTTPGSQAAPWPMAYWPVPIAVEAGGELLVNLVNGTSVAKNVRITFWVALVDAGYGERGEEAA